MEKKVYIITRSTTLNGGDCENKILGAYSTKENATSAFIKEILNAQEWLEEYGDEEGSITIQEEITDTLYTNYSLFGGHSLTLEIQEFPLC